LLLVVAAGDGVLWWWKSGKDDAPATEAVTGPADRGSQAPSAAPRKQPAPAGIEVTVTGERGPIGGAVVRLAPEDGEVLVVQAASTRCSRA
jgi:hypothetical protein